MTPPTSQVGSALAAMGVLATSAALGGTFGDLAARKQPGETRLGATAAGAVGGIMLSGLGGVAAAAFAPPWRKLGLWTAGLGLGLPLLAMAVAEIKSGGQSAHLGGGVIAAGIDRRSNLSRSGSGAARSR